MLSAQRVIHPATRIEYAAPLSGVIAPLLTPERHDGRIDFGGLEAQADYFCKRESVSSIIVRSGPGRMWSYSLEETRDAFRCVLQVAKDRKPVIANCAGIWDGNAAEPPRPAAYRRQAVELSEWALAHGAFAAMQPVPVGLLLNSDYPPQDVALRYFEDLSVATTVPILIYNQSDLPAACALTPATLERLAHRKNIVGVLYNTTDIQLLGDLVRRCPPGFAIGAANEAVAGGAWLAGACASAGPMASLFPDIVHAGWLALAEGEIHHVWRMQRDLLELHAALSAWTVWDIGCVAMAWTGIAMSPRSRDGGRTPMPEEAEAFMRLATRIRMPYQ